MTDDDGDLDATDANDNPPASVKRARTRPGPIDWAIAAATKRICDERGWYAQNLANAVTPTEPDDVWDRTRAIRFLAPLRRFTVTEVAELIAGLRISPLVFYEEAGIVEVPDNTESYIENDVHLESGDRKTMARQYRGLRAEAEKAREDRR